MKCIICKGETIEKKLVKEEVLLNKNIILIPVKVLVCKTCGERYYDRKTIQYLEQMEKEIKVNRKKFKVTGQVLQPA